MGTSDISRNIFDEKKHYAGVRMQQGRITLDDDWNENERISFDERIKTNYDIIGEYGTPNDGFKISVPEVTNNAINFKINKGTYYIGGLRVTLNKDEFYLNQENWLTLQNDDKNKLEIPSEEGSRIYFVYLEAWQQTVTAVEDEELLEKSLGGPDTSTRIRTMHRVKIINTDKTNSPDCGKILQTIRKKNTSNLILTVAYNKTPATTDSISPVKGYLGSENQTIRIQITSDGKFTWGFNNASPLYRCKYIGVKSKVNDEHILEILTLSMEYHSLKKEQVVELLPRSAVLPNGQKIAEIVGPMGKLKNYDSNSHTIIVAIDGFDETFFKEWNWENNSDNQIDPDYFYMHIWDRGNDLASEPEIAIPLKAVPLGYTGLTVKISGDGYIPGDYWVIAARTLSPEKVLPWKAEEGIPPIGIKRFFAPLAFIEWTTANNITEGKMIQDCRKIFPSFSNMNAGDIHYHNPDFKNIETVKDALDELFRRRSLRSANHIYSLNRLKLTLLGFIGRWYKKEKSQ